MNRVKILSMLAAMTFTMYSCSNDEVVENEVNKDNGAVQFSVGSRDSRLFEMNNGTIRISGFGVFGYYTQDVAWTDDTFAPNYMYNQKVELDKSSKEDRWFYTPLKYWPGVKDHKLSFFAYAPYENTENNMVSYGIQPSDNKQKGAPSLLFETKDAPADMVDLITAVEIDKTKAENNTNVAFKFDHVLSRVSFNVSNSMKDAYVNIKNVSLNFLRNNNVYKTATYCFPNSNDEQGSWNYENGVKFKGLMSLLGILNVQDVSMGEYKTSGVLVPSQNNASIFVKDRYMFFIPAEGNQGLNKDAISVTFDYDVITEDSSVAGGYTSVKCDGRTINIEPGNMVQGKSYNLNFVLDADKIELQPNVNPANF